MALILDGKAARVFYASLLKEKIKKMGRMPVLVILQIGGRKESNAYIEQKIKFGRSVGVLVRHIKFPESVKEETIIEEIELQNDSREVDGIILQLPIPQNLPKQKIIDTISKHKDVDGLTTENVKGRVRGDKFAVVPATARGTMELLEFYKIDPKGKKAAVLGRSQLTGAPIAEALQKAGAKVTVCHSHTPNEEEITRKSDLIVVAIGKAKFINANFINPNKKQIVVDVGINPVENSFGVKTSSKLMEEIPTKSFVGDVDFEKVEPLVAAISPVPHGVGQMTVLGLFENLADCAESRIEDF